MTEVVNSETDLKNECLFIIVINCKYDVSKWREWLLVFYFFIIFVSAYEKPIKTVSKQYLLKADIDKDQLSVSA